MSCTLTGSISKEQLARRWDPSRRGENSEEQNFTCYLAHGRGEAGGGGKLKVLRSWGGKKNWQR
jgi:hypothetical protein